MTTCSHCGCEQTECSHCGKPLSNRRSESDHRRFFALIRAAFDNWPELHEFQPDNPDHLRAWLQCKAGYRNVTAITTEDDVTETMLKLVLLTVEAAIKAAKTHAFPRIHKHGIVVFTPKSIAYATLPQKEFNSVRDAVTEIIELEVGVPADKLLLGAQNAA